MINQDGETYAKCNLKGFDQSASYTCLEARDSQSGFQITLSKKEGGKTLITWGDGVVSYKKTDESDRMKMAVDLKDSGLLGNKLVMINNSRYVKWILDQSYGINESYSNLKHFVIISSNDVFDVIDYDDPRFQSL